MSPCMARQWSTGLRPMGQQRAVPSRSPRLRLLRCPLQPGRPATESCWKRTTSVSYAWTRCGSANGESTTRRVRSSSRGGRTVSGGGVSSRFYTFSYNYLSVSYSTFPCRARHLLAPTRPLSFFRATPCLARPQVRAAPVPFLCTVNGQHSALRVARANLVPASAIPA